MVALARVSAKTWLCSLLLSIAACASTPAKGPIVQGGRLKVHDDLGFALTSQEPPTGGYEIREIREPIGPGETLSVRLVTKILDERERGILVSNPDAISQIWPNSLELERSDLVDHVSERAWQAFDYDPSGLAHEDFEGGHSTYATPARVMLHVAFVHHGALIVVHASVELDPPGPKAPDEAALFEKYGPQLERAVARLGR